MFPSVSISLVCPFVGWMVACLTGLSEGLRKNKILNIASSDVFRHFCSYCTVSHGLYETYLFRWLVSVSESTNVNCWNILVCHVELSVFFRV